MAHWALELDWEYHCVCLACTTAGRCVSKDALSACHVMPFTVCTGVARVLQRCRGIGACAHAARALLRIPGDISDVT
jgi:hypothetical protein